MSYVEGDISGFKLWLPEHRANRPVNPWWEAARLHCMHHFMTQEPGITIEVGAEEGDFAALFALWGQDVILVEPNPKAWPWIAQTFNANDLNHKAVLKWVGFCESGERRLEDDSMSRIASGEWWPECAFEETIPEHGFHNVWEHPTVTPGATLDEIVGWQDTFAPVAHVSIDVEGSELIVLRGAEGLMAGDRPRFYVSVHPQFARQFYGFEDNEIHEFMAAHDYVGTFLAEDHERHYLYSPSEKAIPK